MKLVLLVHVLIGATSGARLLSESATETWCVAPPDTVPETAIVVYSDSSCSTELGADGVVVTSDEFAADMGNECTPAHGECFPLSTACDTRLAALCDHWSGEYNDNVRAVMIKWMDHSPPSSEALSIGGVVGGCIGGVVVVGGYIVLFLWLCGAFGSKCPSPLKRPPLKRQAGAPTKTPDKEVEVQAA